MPIRVLHIIGNLKFGGAEICVKSLVENFPGDKVEAFVYPLRCDAPDITINAKVITNSYRAYDPRKFFDILKICREQKIDIVHAHLEKPVIAALLATFCNKIPAIIHEHGSIVLPGFNNSCYRMMLRLFHKRASAYIAVSGDMQKSLQQRAGIGADKIKVIYNSINFESFVPDADKRKEIRDSLNISGDKIVLGFSGRLHKVKGPDILIRTLAMLNRESKKYHLLLAGDGQERRSLEELALRLGVSDEVNFLGFRDDMPAVINAFDVALIPSRHEAFGIAAVEFMRMKVPVVSSAVDGLKEIFENEKNCLVTEQNTPEHICACVNRLIEDNDLRCSLVEQAYHDADRFSIQKQLCDIEALYEKVISQANKVAVD